MNMKLDLIQEFQVMTQGGCSSLARHAKRGPRQPHVSSLSSLSHFIDITTRRQPPNAKETIHTPIFETAKHRPSLSTITSNSLER
jgi:hypothetical protein